MQQMVRLIIADDHEMFRTGLIQVLNSIPGFNVVAETGDGDELVKLCFKHQPDIILTDIRMDNLDGISATKQILEQDNHVIILALSMYEDEHTIYEMLAAGARGYIFKTVRREGLIEAIETVRQTNRYYLGAKSMRLASLLKKYMYPELPKKSILFSDRELEIIRLMCQELSTGEIAEQLFLSPKTISWHRNILLEKTGAKKAIGIILYAIRNKLFPEEMVESQRQ